MSEPGDHTCICIAEIALARQDLLTLDTLLHVYAIPSYRYIYMYKHRNMYKHRKLLYMYKQCSIYYKSAKKHFSTTHMYISACSNLLSSLPIA